MEGMETKISIYWKINGLQGPDMGAGEWGQPQPPDGSPEKPTLALIWYTMRQKLESEARYLLPG